MLSQDTLHALSLLSVLRQMDRNAQHLKQFAEEQLNLWTTIGGHAEGGKKHVGGTHVKVDSGGRIAAGPAPLKGKTLGELKKEPEKKSDKPVDKPKPLGLSSQQPKQERPVTETTASNEIEWTSKSGRHVSVTPDDTDPDNFSWNVTLDGKHFGNSRVFPVSSPSFASMAEKLKALGATHVLLCGRTPIAVPAEIGTKMQTAQTDADDRPPSLDYQRQELVDRVHGAADEWSAAREAAYQGDTGRGWGKAQDADDRLKKAEEKLSQFDREHPEIVASIRAKEKEDTERFLRSD